MKRHRATSANLALCEHQCPGYTATLRPAIIQQDAHHVVVDLDHSAAIKAGKARADALRRTSMLGQAAGVAKAGTRAAKSLAKTTLGINRLSDAEVNLRLDVCRECPGGHAIFKRGKVHTCGPMLKSMRQKRRKTCGCILRAKARDRKEDCPFGYWPNNPDHGAPEEDAHLPQTEKD